MKKNILGKGLDALIPKDDKTDKEFNQLDIQIIHPNSSQPRNHFDKDSINELAQSIKENGLLQPIVVRKKGDEFEIIAGERRWRACQIAGLKKISAVIKESVSDSNTLELALIENLQRENLNPIEEAEAYNQLVTNFKLTHEEISKKIGKNRSTITNQIRLLQLTDKAKKALISRQISSGHARALLSLESKDQIDSALQKILNKNLSVRKTEELIKDFNNTKLKKENLKEKDKEKDDDNYYFVQDLIEKLTITLGTKVKIKRSGNRGKIEIEYYSTEEMDRIIGMILTNR